jgi:hypothetical protein
MAAERAPWLIVACIISAVAGWLLGLFYEWLPVAWLPLKWAAPEALAVGAVLVCLIGEGTCGPRKTIDSTKLLVPPEGWRIEQKLAEYAAYSNATEILPGCQRKEGRYVVGRAVVLVCAAWMAYQVPGWGLAAWVIAGFAAYTFIDAVGVTTAHSFLFPHGHRSAFRFVILNLGVFFTLPVWFTIALAPFRRHFDPPLDYWYASELAFSLIQLPGASTIPDPRGQRASVVVGLMSICALYFLLVILVAAVDRLSESHQKAAEGSTNHDHARPTL